MTLYLDADIVVATVLTEADSAAIVGWLDGEAEDFALGDLAVGEIVAALYRAVRNERIDHADLTGYVAAVDSWHVSSCTAISHTGSDIRRAAEYVRHFDLALRMPDAIHLATCGRLGMTIATRDRRVLRAAEALGIDAVRPG